MKTIIGWLKWAGWTVVISAVVHYGVWSTSASTTYFDSVDAQAPVAYWRFNEVSGVIAYNAGSLGQAADGTYGSNVELGQPGLLLSSEDPALRLPAKDVQSRMLLTSLPMPPSAVTVTFLVQGQDDGLSHLLGYAVGSSDNEFTFGSTAGAFRSIIQGNIFDFQGVDVLDGVPHHIGITWQATSGLMSLYVDGRQVGSRTVGTGHELETGGIFVVGQDLDSVIPPSFGMDPAQAYAGSIDELAVFGRVLTPQEIAIQSAAAFQTHTGIEVYFAEDVSPWPVDNTDTVPRPGYSNSQGIAAQFLARLRGTGTESFEGYPPDSSPTVLFFGTNTAVLSGSAPGVYATQTVSSPDQAPSGIFPITGTNLLVLSLGSVTQPDTFFHIAFSSPQAAIGFYGMDPERNSFRLTLIRADGSTDNIVPPITIPQGSAGVFYLGVIDRARPFTGVRFHNLGAVPEGFGFDDLTIGEPAQVGPAPAHLQLGQDRELRIQGTVGATYRIEFSAVLPATNWFTLKHLLLKASPSWLTDTTATNAPQRFYRAKGIQ